MFQKQLQTPTESKPKGYKLFGRKKWGMLAFLPRWNLRNIPLGYTPIAIQEGFAPLEAQQVAFVLVKEVNHGGH